MPVLCDLPVAPIWDIIPRTITGSVTGGDVDENCEFTVQYLALVHNNCCKNGADLVTVDNTLTTGNATLTNPTRGKWVGSDGDIEIAGSET